MSELTGKERRKTRLQLRGNFLDLGDEVTEGVPAAFHAFPKDAPQNRLELAQWLVAARTRSRRASSRIGSGSSSSASASSAPARSSARRANCPSHPELLDWLATELQTDWDVKRFLKLLVTSAAYRQSSRVTPELVERDPDNRLLARGPRVRLSAEMVRDQALFAAGLLSPKMYGPSVRPPQPNLGVSAAFGGAIDWQTERRRGQVTAAASTRHGGGRTRIRRWPRSTRRTARPASSAARAPTRRCKRS